jgi:succinate dehydrogenase / fumarate reductase cytochrome b subunit
LDDIQAITGVLALGSFVITHLWIQSSAMRGRDAYTEALPPLDSVAFAAVEVLTLYVPLVVHAAIGVSKMRGRLRASVSKTERTTAGYQGLAWPLRFQHLSAIVVLLFLVHHLLEFTVPRWRSELRSEDYYAELVARLSGTTAQGIPLMALIHLVGVAAVSYHVSFGMFRACQRFGLIHARFGVRAWASLFSILGTVLFLLGTRTVIYLATGSRFFF